MDIVDYKNKVCALEAENSRLRAEAERLSKENTMLMNRQEEADVAGVLRHLKENKIWLIWTGSYSDKDVAGAYSTEKNANDMLQFMTSAKVGYGHEDAHVEEYDMDVRTPKAYHLWQANWRSSRYDESGHMVPEDFDSEEEAFCLLDNQHMLRPDVSEHAFNDGKGFKFYQAQLRTTAMTKDEALKKLYDAVAQLKAEALERGIEFPSKAILVPPAAPAAGIIKHIRRGSITSRIRNISNTNLYWG